MGRSTRSVHRWLILFVLVGQCHTPQTQRAKEGPLDRSDQPIKLQLQASSADGSVAAVLTFQNTGTTPVTLNLRNAVDDVPPPGRLPVVPQAGHVFELCFLVIDSEGRSLALTSDVKHLPLVAEHFQTLAPGLTHSAQIPLSRYFALKAGRSYRLQVAYLNGDDGARFGVKAWVGAIQSNIVELTLPRSSIPTPAR